MVLLILFLPLLACIISGLFGRYLGYNITKIIVIILIGISLLLSLNIYYNVMILNNEYNINLGYWINIESFNVNWSFNIDKLTSTMLIPVLSISFLVYIYASNYMNSDPHQIRFFSYLSLFTFFMLILVSGDNYLILFIGWEFVGVASYLLISFWYTRIQAMKSGLSAILLNRMGDALFVLALCILIYLFNSLDFDIIFSLIPYISTDWINILMLCFLIAATAKSAQFGLHAWLTSAMEGPTPVSALLHAATMVVAGVYLLIRSSPILEYSPTILLCILWLGGLTTIIAGLIGVASNDIKRIIALSTMSQLAMMMIAIGVSSYNLALYHLFCHSFFKALLFMSAGAIIHSTINEYQDMRSYGGYLNFLPFSYTNILIASLSLMAIPSLTGFYSKDIIIESMIGNYQLSGFIIYWLALLSAILTGLYSIKILYLTFFNTPNNSKYNYFNLGENDLLLCLPMIILAFSSIFIGYICRDIYLGIGHEFIFIHPNNINIIETEFGINSIFKLLPLILSISLSLLFLYFYEFNRNFITVYNNSLFKSIYIFFNQKVMFELILNNLILRKFLLFGGYLFHFVDQGILKILGPNGLWYFSSFISYYISIYQSGSLYDYSLFILIGLLTIIIIFLLNINIFIIFITIISLFISYNYSSSYYNS